MCEEPGEFYGTGWQSRFTQGQINVRGLVCLMHDISRVSQGLKLMDLSSGEPKTA